MVAFQYQAFLIQRMALNHLVTFLIRVTLVKRLKIPDLIILHGIHFKYWITLNIKCKNKKEPGMLAMHFCNYTTKKAKDKGS